MENQTHPAIREVLRLAQLGEHPPKLLMQRARAELNVLDAPHGDSDITVVCDPTVTDHDNLALASGKLIRSVEAIIVSLAGARVITMLSAEIVDSLVECRNILQKLGHERLSAQSAPAFIYNGKRTDV